MNDPIVDDMPRDRASNPIGPWTTILRTWASIGADLNVSESYRTPDWNAATRMLERLRPGTGEKACGSA